MSASSSTRSPTGNGVVVIPEGEGAGKHRIPANKSSQKLVNEDYLQRSSNRSSAESGEIIPSGATGDNVSSDDNTPEMGSRRTKVTKMEWITVFILFYVNLINYMDRFTLAGILDDVEKAFSIDKGQQGLLQTVFVISYMIFAPIFGYMGDRYSRKIIMSFGVLLWSVTTLAGSFMENQFGWFIAFRAMVGIGEASYSTIAPTIISDLFLDDMRSRMLALFYFAIPVGGGLGYIVGAKAANLAGAWYWSLRVTPVLGIIAVVLILFVMIDPPRGEREGSTSLKTTSWSEDLKYLCKNKSFMLTTFGFTCVTFVTGALSWWGPTYIFYGLRLQDSFDGEQSDVSYKFGVITMISGIIGVPLGSVAATKLRTKSMRADPLICAFGLLVSTPLIFGGALLARTNEWLCFTLIFFGEVFLNLNWSIVADILLYVIIPTRRSTAEAFQILVSHALGDAGSPYLIGKVAEWIKPALLNEAAMNNGTLSDPIFASVNIEDKTSNGTNYYVEFQSLQYSLFINVFVQILGGIFFLLTAWYIVADKSDCDAVIAQSSGGHLMPDGGSSSQSQSDDEDEERSLRRNRSSTSYR